jgi:hypothetical protein
MGKMLGGCHCCPRHYDSRKCQHSCASFVFIEGNSSMALGTIRPFGIATMSPAIESVSFVSEARAQSAWVARRSVADVVRKGLATQPSVNC